jgi:YD repeat-containing protein
LQRGNTTYAYAPDGWLQSKTEGAAFTRYAYDLFGNLRTTSLPSGKQLTYLIDGGNRRIGKQVDGVNFPRRLRSSKEPIHQMLVIQYALSHD